MGDAGRSAHALGALAVEQVGGRPIEPALHRLLAMVDGPGTTTTTTTFFSYRIAEAAKARRAEQDPAVCGEALFELLDELCQREPGPP